MGKSKKVLLGNYGKSQKTNRKIFFYLLIVIVLLLGFFYQMYSIYASADQYGRVGKLIDIEGYRMHLYTSISSSDASLVFASNIGTATPYTNMHPLFSKLSDKHSVAVYDKPGYGWSDITNASRDIDSIVNEIHLVLNTGEYPKPRLFVAHSMGSLEVLRYAQLYPDEVAGIVLIDGASPEFCSKFNNIMIVESFLINGLRNIGALRLFSHTETMQKTINANTSLSEELQVLNTGIALEKSWNRNMIEEKLKLQDNAKMILENGFLGDIPLRIITSKANPYGTWQTSQVDMLSLSSNSSQTYIQGSVDFIEKTDLNEILNVINELIISLQPEED